MQQEINRWVDFFQVLILTRFRQTQPQAIETLTSLLIGHLFGLCNLNQLADALCIPKSGLYEHLSKWSLYQWQRLLVVVGCQQVVDTIKQIEQMSASTKSRRRITLCVDDTVEQRHGKVLAYCYSWYSGRFKKTLKGQNLLAVTVRIGEEVVPLCVRLVGKQGRANTQKPQILVEMLREIIAFFDTQGIDITHYPITFDSWYASQPLRENLSELGFSQILVHAKTSFVFETDSQRGKLSVHKRTTELLDDQWGCDCPIKRLKAESPTFGACILLFFINSGQVKCMMVFGSPLRSAEILAIWHQHHSIEQFWRQLKSIVRLVDMRLAGRCGAYAGVAVKVLSYLLLLSVATATAQTPHQVILYLKGDRHALFEQIEAFQPNTVP